MRHDAPFHDADAPNAGGGSPPAGDPGDMAQQALSAAAAAVSGLAGEVAGAAPATPAPGKPDGVTRPLDLPALGGQLSPAQARALDLLSDVNLNVKIELGRTRMLVEDVLRLSDGAVVELDKLAGDPVDVYVNERHIARGEVLVLNDNFCVRINEIIQSPAEAESTPGPAKKQ